MNAKQHKFYRGGILYDICDFLEIDDKEKASKRIHKAIKECFDVDSFSNLSTSDFSEIVNELMAYFASEHGYMLKEDDEREYDINEMTMKEFLEKKKIS